MGVFHRRYFCVFSLLFLLASFVAAKLEFVPKLTVAAVFLLFAIISLVLVLCNKRRRFAFLVVLVCIVFVFVGFFNSILFISLPQNKASNYVGRHPVEMKVLYCEYSTEYASEYIVRIQRLGEESTDIKGRLCLDFASELPFAERIITLADIELYDGYGNDNADVLLDVSVCEGAEIYHKSDNENAYFSLDGIGAVLHEMRTAFTNYINELFGEKDGALLRGFLINDTSGLSAKTMSDFRRSGVSHLLSVSGFHIALLLGTLELLLRKLYVPKKVRCVAIALFGVFFLALTDFSGSAVRSALMLFAVYLSFMFSEDSDQITTLFGSVFLIVLKVGS